MSAVPRPKSGEPLLSVRDLHVTYPSRSGPVPAVRGVTSTSRVGETLGLAGESGCGKSSLAGALLRLLPKGTEVTGEVLLDGEDVLTMKPGRLRAVRWTELAIVFQGALHTLNPVQRVGAPDRRGDPSCTPTATAASQTRVGELLELVGLPARRARDYPHQLSGGQRQRVLIALALACEPRLLIADEPTTALDVMVQAQVLRLLEDLQERFGLAVVFITHDLSTLAAVCRRTGGHVRGPDRRAGAERRGVREPGASVHARARGGLPGDRRPGVPHAARPAWPGDPPDPRELPAGCPFHPRCPGARRSAAPRATSSCGPPAGARGGLRPRPRRTGGGRVSDAPLLEVRDLHVEFPSRTRRRRARSTASTSRCAAARSSRWSASPAAARRRSRARSSACSGRPRARSRLRGEPLRYDRRALREHRRTAQMIFQDPTGALNARQTIYEAVAEGVRIQSSRATRSSSSPRRSRAPACARPSASSPATRTRSPAASASAW